MLEAYGVCFIEGERMTPLVKVPEAGTLVFEGSCGSGTLASAIALSRGMTETSPLPCGSRRERCMRLLQDRQVPSPRHPSAAR